jgi:SAM-dependent methyltransferase
MLLTNSSSHHPEVTRLQTVFGWQLPNQVVGSTASSTYTDEHTLGRAQIDSRSWWYSTRNQIFIRAFHNIEREGAIWEVGCGTGVVAHSLVQTGHSVVGVEPSLAGASVARDLGISVFATTLEQLRLPDESVYTIGLFDVLEHVDERPTLLSEVHRVLRDKGMFLISVPALPWLWSAFDVEERHQLRYTRRTLRAELESYGFEILRSGYFFALTVVPLLFLRALPYRLGLQVKLQDNTAVGATGGRLGKLLAAIEKFLAFRTPFGSSLLVIARKR